MVDLAPLRTDRDALLRELSDAGAEIRRDGREIKCLFHEDKHASAGVYQDDAGVWKYKCQAACCGFGGDVLDVRAKLQGKPVADVVTEAAKEIAPRPTSTKATPAKAPTVYPTLEKLTEAATWQAHEWGGKLTTTHIYAHPGTKHHDMIVFRVEGDGRKTFRQAHQTDAGYIMRAPPGKWPIYNRARLAGAASVIAVEGEKCVHALHAVGVVATTSPGGAGKAALADWTPLAAKTVYLWPDCDPADPKTGKRTGLEHMRQVAVELSKLTPAPSVRWIDCDQLELPPKGDCCEYLDKFPTYTPEQKRVAVEAVLEGAAEYTIEPNAIAPTWPPSSTPTRKGALDALLDDAVAGRRYVVPLPWPQLAQATRALLPGTVTILCGPPGSTKSFALVQCLIFWTQREIPAALLALEYGTGPHARRALAQIVGDAHVDDDEWCRTHPEKVKAYRTQATPLIDAVESRIDALPDDVAPTPDNFLKWLDAKAPANRVICFDPVTAMEKGRDTWTSDGAFLSGAKRIIQRHGASLLLVSHPRKMQANAAPAMDDLSGGACYSRFSQTIFYVHWHKLKPFTVNKGVGVASELANRTIGILKANNGRGVEGAKFAMHFDGRTLTLNECGRIQESSGNA